MTAQFDGLHFREYRKAVLTRARVLTDKDVEAFGGVIDTKEGPASFVAGDYLAVGVSGEQWPIMASTMAQIKIQVSQQDENGWALYANTNTVRAAQVPREFSVEISTGDTIFGKANDYLVENEGRHWIVDQEIFEKTYEAV